MKKKIKCNQFILNQMPIFLQVSLLFWMLFFPNNNVNARPGFFENLPNPMGGIMLSHTTDPDAVVHHIKLSVSPLKLVTGFGQNYERGSVLFMNSDSLSWEFALGEQSSQVLTAISDSGLLVFLGKDERRLAVFKPSEIFPQRLATFGEDIFIFTLKMTRDGGMLLLGIKTQGVYDYTILAMNPLSGELIWEASIPRLAQFDGIEGIEIAEQAKICVVTTYRGHFIVDMNDGSLLQSNGNYGQIPAVISEDGRYIAEGDFDGNVSLYEWNPLSEKYDRLWNMQHKDSWPYVHISDDGSTLAVLEFKSSFLSRLQIFSTPGKIPLWSEYLSDFGNIDMTPDGRLIAVGMWGDLKDLEPDLLVFERENPVPVFSFITPGSVFDIDLSDDGIYLAAGTKLVHARILGRGGETYVFELDCYSDKTVYKNNTNFDKFNSYNKDLTIKSFDSFEVGDPYQGVEVIADEYGNSMEKCIIGQSKLWRVNGKLDAKNGLMEFSSSKFSGASIKALPFPTKEKRIFKRQSSFFNPDGVDVFAQSHPVLFDIDGNGHGVDMIIGIYDGLILGYLNKTLTGNYLWEELPLFTENFPAPSGNAAPAVGDLDDDGDWDLISGQFLGPIIGYRNQGFQKTPKFLPDSSLVSGVKGSFYCSCPTLGDLDGDGDLDLIIGERGEHLYGYRNIGNSKIPQFTVWESLFDSLYFGYLNCPQLYDLDHDGDLDLIDGSRSGGLFYYFENIGTPDKPKFVPEPYEFFNVHAGWRSAPALGDVDMDGTEDLVLGSESGPLSLYNKCTHSRKDSWVKVPAAFNGFFNGLYSTVFIEDMDQDGSKDIITCSENCIITLLKKNPETEKTTWIQDSLYFNGIMPSYFPTPCANDLDLDGDFDLVLGGINGDIICYINQGTPECPVWQADSSIFAEISVDNFSAPALGDITSDGLPDLVVGDGEGNLYSWENTGSAGIPEWTYAPELLLGVNKCAGRIIPVLADIDLDEDLDLIIGKTASGIDLYLNHHSTWLLYLGFFDDALPLNNSAPALGDLSGDAFPDLVVGSYGGGLGFYVNASTTQSRLSRILSRPGN